MSNGNNTVIVIENNLQISIHSEVDARSSLVRVLRTLASNPALAEEYADEGRVVDAGPVTDGEGERVPVVVWRITEVEIAVHRELEKIVCQ